MQRRPEQTYKTKQHTQTSHQPKKQLLLSKKNITSTNKIEDKNNKTSAYVQDLIGNKQFIGGMVLLEDSSIVAIQEVYPINFYQKTNLERNELYLSFYGLMKIAPSTLHLKMRTEKADVNAIINNIYNSNSKEESQRLLREMKDYLAYIKNLQDNDSLCTRYYIIWEYEGDSEGKISSDINEIYRAMEAQRYAIKSILMNEMGHICVTPKDMNYYVGELLYKHFNPYSSVKEPFANRVLRLQKDADAYNRSVPIEDRRVLTEADYVAPRGIKFKSFGRYMIIDGMYTTYICLKDIGHPSKVVAGWTNLLYDGLGYDIDVILKKQPYEISLSTIKRGNRLSRVYANKKRNDIDKSHEIQKSISNKDYIIDKMENADEDIFNCIIIVTIRASSYQNMMEMKTSLMGKLKSKSLYTEDSFLNVQRYFRMTMPFTYIEKSIFRRNRRNYLTSSAASLYNFSSYELFDSTGIVVGQNTSNGSMLSINPFNTDYFSNPHMLILGGSGSGKSYLEMMLSRRFRLTNCRTYFILPIKAHEYSRHIKSLGGEMINLYPGGSDCINIMQIRPEAKINMSVFDKDDSIEKASLLSKKITSITVFIQLLMKEHKMTSLEINKLNSVITEIYKRFGITNDNDSIYRNKAMGILKEMPILQDLYDVLVKDELLYEMSDAILPFIEGSFHNFNAQTNVNLQNRCIAFNIDEDTVGEDYLPALMYMAFDCMYDLTKQDSNSTDICIIDEAWKMMINEFCAKQINKAIKILRGFACGVIITSQEINDFLTGYGKSIISNTKTKILLKMEPGDVKDLIKNDVVDLTSKEMRKLVRAKRGHGFLCNNGDKIFINFRSSLREEWLFTTDIKRRRELETLFKRKTQRTKSG